jgi:hypothetical protein
LTILPPGNIWWLGFGIGGLLLVFVFLAEYIVVEPSAPQYAIATAGLTALAFAVYLILTTALRFSGARLFLVAPALFIADRAGQPAHIPPARQPKMGVHTGRWESPWFAPRLAPGYTIGRYPRSSLGLYCSAPCMRFPA